MSGTQTGFKLYAIDYWLQGNDTGQPDRCDFFNGDDTPDLHHHARAFQRQVNQEDRPCRRAILYKRPMTAHEWRTAENGEAEGWMKVDEWPRQQP